MREFRDYLKYARKHLSLAEEAAKKQDNTELFLIPAIILAWSAMESFVNSRCEDLNSLPNDIFELHERAFLLEKHLRLQDSGDKIGKFILEGSEYQTLENKIFFLLSKMGTKGAASLKGGTLWQRFKTFKDVRDNLVHPRRFKEINLKVQDVKENVDTAQELIQEISERIWGKKIKF
jgi:hypothetical protein